jgi:UDP-N-acetylmuramate--alanine ligase
MISLPDIKHIYFIGIGGIGMSAVARYFASRGVKVSGYDRTPTTLTRELEKSGMNIHYDENIDLLPKDVQLVVYTPAIPVSHQELQYFLENGYSVVKRSDALQIISNSSFNICVAGTHGKTTTSTMVAHILRHSGYGCNAFLGGIAANYDTNFWTDERNVCVIEADEYDRSFLKLSPDIAVISSMDPDHLDIYGTAEEMENAFIEFAAKLKPGGMLFSKFGLKRSKELERSGQFTYSLNNRNANAYASGIEVRDGSYVFDVITKDWGLDSLELNMGGLHNIENSVVAIAIAHHLGIEDTKIKKAIRNFKGVKRRFEYVFKKGGLVFIDDYAHHPEELKALINGAMNLFSDKKCTVIFQPHLYSRTRDFADGFAASLDLADEVVLLPIYPARELPIEGVNAEMILSRMKSQNKVLLNKEELLSWIKDKYARTPPNEVIITSGAGDIDQLVEPIKEIISNI